MRAWRSALRASKDEALLAVELYNSRSQPRRLEAFYVHMHLAWLYLLHAKFTRDRIDFRYWSDGRLVRVDGEPKTWELARCVAEEWPENHPVRKNLELSIALRNQIEHRYANLGGVADRTAGYAQAMLVNYETTLMETFGTSEGIGGELRFPIFVNSITAGAMQEVVRQQARIPAGVRNLLADFESGLDAGVTSDQRYEFRVRLIPQTGPRSDSDVAISFLREDDLTPAQQKALAVLGRSGTVIVRQQLRAVVSHGLMKPSTAAAAVEARIPFKFGPSGPFVQAWKALQVRPPVGDPHPERTDERYCTYDEPHGDYLYTQAFVDKIVARTRTAPKYRAFIGREPRPKAPTVTPLSTAPSASPSARSTGAPASSSAEATPA